MGKLKDNKVYYDYKVGRLDLPYDPIECEFEQTKNRTQRVVKKTVGRTQLQIEKEEIKRAM